MPSHCTRLFASVVIMSKANILYHLLPLYVQFLIDTLASFLRNILLNKYIFKYLLNSFFGVSVIV